MLTKIKFENFKSWKLANVDCAPITAFFGANSSGKTSLLQFLLLLKQTRDATDRMIPIVLEGDLLSLGSITEVMHRKNKKSHLKWHISMDLDSELVLFDTTRKGKEHVVAQGSELEIESGIYIRNQVPHGLGLQYSVNQHKFALRPEGQNVRSFEKFELVYKSPEEKEYVTPSQQTEFEFMGQKHNGSGAWPALAPIKSYAFPDKVRAYFQNAEFLSELGVVYENQMDRIYYLGPLRVIPERQYFGIVSRPPDVGKSGEHTIGAIIAATRDKERRRLSKNSKSMSFQEMIAHWLRQMGLLQEFRVSEIAPRTNTWHTPVKVNANSSEVLLPDVGFGVSQVLPVITLLQYVPEGSTVLLEQPELHLHPLAQTELADLIIYATTQRKVQVILESHSEHLLLRLQRRVAETKLANDEAKFYFCENDGVSSTLNNLEIDSYGKISNWPNKFMGDAFGEVAATLKQALKRKKADENRR